MSSPEKQDVHVSAQPNVIGQVPSNMVWVLVNYDLVRIPKPVITVVVVGWGNAEVEAAKPEAFPVSSFKPPDMVAAKATPEPPVLPGMVDVISDIITVSIVPDPLTVLVNVRSVWMAFLVAIIAPFGRVGRFRANWRRTTRLCRPRLLTPRLNSGRRWTVTRDLSNINTVIRPLTALVASVFVLGKSTNRKH